VALAFAFSPGERVVDAKCAARLDTGGGCPHVKLVAQFPGVWETVIMAKRSLRVLKRVSNIASLGVCEACNAQFSANPRQLGQAGVQQQFNAHKCEVTQGSAPIARDKD